MIRTDSPVTPGRKPSGGVPLARTLTLWFLLVALFACGTVSVLTYYDRAEAMRETIFAKLELLRDGAIVDVNLWVAERRADVELWAEAPTVVDACERHTKGMPPDEKFPPPLEAIRARYAYHAVFIADPATGVSILSSTQNGGETPVLNEPHLGQVVREGRSIISDVQLEPVNGRPFVVFAAPVRARDTGQITGALVFQEDMTVAMYPRLIRSGRFDETGDILLVNQQGIVQSPPRFHENAVGKLTITAEPAKRAAGGQTGCIAGLDYRSVSVVAAYGHIDETHWGLVVKQNMTEINAPVARMARNISFISLAVLLVAGLIGLFVARFIARPASANATLEQRVLEATQALREERDFASAVLATAGALVVVLDREGRIVRFNRACEQTSGYTANEAIGRRVWDFLLTPEDVEPVKGVFRDLRDGHFPNTYENFWVAKDASRRWIAWSSTALVDAHGKVEYVIGTGINMTERLRLEEQLRHSQKMEAIGTLAAGVAHDFNNLLTAILGYAELARRGVAPGSEAMLSLTGIETVAMEAGGVAQSLLTFSRKAPNRKAPVHLGRLVEASTRMLRRMVPAAIEIVTDVSRADDLWVHADATQLQQVVMNLAVNARDAMPNGGTLRLTVHAGPPDKQNAAPTAVMVVQDTGTGMSAEVLARVFEPFFTTKPRERGTGLGMAVVHGIVTDHGGRIEIESKEGYGTQVSVRFPCCAAPADDASPPEPPSAIRGHGETVLVVDDNPQVLAIITSTLRSAGYQVVSASDGDAAMTTFEANRERTRLVILDLDLPRRSGLACLKEMRRHRSDLPALLVSGSIEADLESAARNDTRILRKPFQVQELGRIVSELLNGGECDESVDAG